MESSQDKAKKGFKVHNTITGRLHEFDSPQKHPEVTIYLCGLTTYDYAHLGNMRGPILFDVFRKFLKVLGYKVKFVTNFTDVDDKVIKRANESGVDWESLTRKFTREYLLDLSALGIEHADVYPKVTFHIPDIIDYVREILDQDFAYVINGNVYFDVRKYHAERKNYGKLSRRNIDEMITESRTEFDENKRDELDFALWKSDPEVGWDSPWGKGRPGWHIECSLMSTKYLGETFDIHSGAIDLKFPHHENEVAQAEAHSGDGTFARVWMHYEFINWKGGKLAKSGESFAVRDLFKKYDPETIRQFILSAKYRSPMDFSDEKMEEIKRSRERIDNFFFEAKRLLGDGIEESRDNLNNKLSKNVEAEKISDPEAKVASEVEIFPENFLGDLRDDFNTQGAFSRIFEIVSGANTLLGDPSLRQRGKEILNLAYLEILWAGSILGLFNDERKQLMQETAAMEILGKGGVSPDNSAEAQKLLDERQRLKGEKKYAEADAVRVKITALGFEVRDTSDGPVLKPKD
ncbi:MAG: cysteine--tRNA ligase [bacterium]